MATVQNAIVMQDRLSGVMRGVINSVEHTVNAMEKLNRASNREIVAKDWGRARVEIGAARAALERFDSELGQIPAHQQRVTQGFESWKGGLTALASGIYTIKAAFQGIKSITDQIDMSTSMQARLGLLTDSAQGTQQFMDDIFEAAQRSRGSYTDMGAQVAKLGLLAGDAFTNNSEIVAFTETMQKAFVVGGASAQEQASAMYQLTQAMGSGRLQGDEYRSIIENAPMLANSIKEYMQNAGVKGTMKEWAADGLLTADVIKAALFNAADDINAKFATMPMTFGQFWQSIKNQAFKAFQPLMQKITELANSEGFKKMINWLVTGLVKIADIIIDVVEYLSEHEALLKGILAAMAAAAVIGAAKWITYKLAVIDATLAQYGLNTAINLCPIFALVGGVVALTFALRNLYNENENFRHAMNSVDEFGQNLDSYVKYYGKGILSGTAFGSEEWDRTVTKPHEWTKRRNAMQAYINDKQYGLPLPDGSTIDWLTEAAKILDKNESVIINGKKMPNINSIYTDEQLIDKVYENAYKIAEERMSAGAFSWEDYKIDGGYLDEVNKINTEVDISKESLAYLVDGVTAKYINNINLQSPAPTVTVNMNGNITNGMDADTFMQQVGDSVLEANSAGTDKAYDFG